MVAGTRRVMTAQKATDVLWNLHSESRVRLQIRDMVSHVQASMDWLALRQSLVETLDGAQQQATDGCMASFSKDIRGTIEKINELRELQSAIPQAVARVNEVRELHLDDASHVEEVALAVRSAGAVEANLVALENELGAQLEILAYGGDVKDD